MNRRYYKILFFGERTRDGTKSWKHLNKKEFRVYSRVKKALNEMLQTEKSVRAHDIAIKLNCVNNQTTMSKYVFMLCSSSETADGHPEFIMRTKLNDNNKNDYLIRVSIERAK